MKSPQGLIKGIKKFVSQRCVRLWEKIVYKSLTILELSVEQKSSVKACLDALEAYFKPKRNVVYERYVFNSSSQQQEESTDEYVNRLRKYAAPCSFGSLTDELIRDRLVLGIRDQATKLRLLKEEKLDLNKAVSMCRASEIASKQLKSMKKESEEEIKFARGQKYSARKPKPRDEKNVKGRKTSRHVVKPGTTERNHRNGTTGTSVTTGTEPPEPAKPPERNHRNQRNHRNGTTGTSVTTETEVVTIEIHIGTSQITKFLFSPSISSVAPKPILFVQSKRSKDKK